MSYKELLEWYEYSQIEPFLSDRVEIMLAKEMQLFANVNRNPKSKPFLIEIKVPYQYIRKWAENALEVYFEWWLKKKWDIWIPKEKVRSTFYDRVAELELIDKWQLLKTWESANKKTN